MTETYLQPETEDQAFDGADAEIPRHFEDLTLAEMFSQLLRAPGATLRALREIASTPHSTATHGIPLISPARPERAASSAVRARSVFDVRRRQAILFSWRLAAFLIAWWGTGILANTPQRSETTALNNGAPFLAAGFLVWLGSEIYADWPAVRGWWARRGLPKPRQADPP